jgi:hypothetical protein
LAAETSRRWRAAFSPDMALLMIAFIGKCSREQDWSMELLGDQQYQFDDYLTKI